MRRTVKVRGMTYPTNLLEACDCMKALDCGTLSILTNFNTFLDLLLFECSELRYNISFNEVLSFSWIVYCLNAANCGTNFSFNEVISFSKVFSG